MEFTVLLDAPAKPVSRFQIAKLGSFHDQRYGDFDITPENVENWRKNLSKLPGGEALIDFEHRSERKPRDSSAAGWITGIDIDGDRVMADARWTPKGERAIRDEEYRFVSPVFGPTEVEGEMLEEALPSVALTNKPFLGTMPAVMLASEERVSEAVTEELDRLLELRDELGDGELSDTELKILDALTARQGATEEQRALKLLDVPQSERDQAVKENNALPDGSYPIRNVKQLKAAATLAASKHGDWRAAQKLIRRRAKELGVDVTTLAGFASERPAASDSRRAMATEIATENLLKTLDLPEDADEQTVLDRLAALKTKADDADKLQRKLEKKPVKTLEQQARDAGLVLLDQAAKRQLEQQAEAGALAFKQLHEERFDRAFKQALADRKATPAEEANLKHFYELDADATLKLLDDREPIPSAMPTGDPAIDLTKIAEADPQEIAAAGIHPGSVQLDAKVRAYMESKGLDEGQYNRVLEQVYSGAVVL